MALTPGAWLGPYEILSPLGAGGMGEVYRARDPRLGREVAIKVLGGSIGGDASRLRRFEHEGRAMAALSHPNVLAIHDINAADPPYLVTELLEGETLRAQIDRGPMTVARAIEIALQLVCGLAAAHGRGIVHRDLKPENIFVTRDGVVKILDFGLAKTADHADVTRAGMTLPGVVLGTVGYMAPEQARGLDADARVDIFAVGAILYELASGQRAFSGRSPADTISAVLNHQPLDVGAGSGISPSLVPIVRRCLEKDANERFQSARDLQTALQTLSAGESARRSVERPAQHSVGVLPFANSSADPDNEYFSDGLAEELINVLGRVSGLRVAARTSAFQFRTRTMDVRQIGKALGVEYVLDGSVRRSGKRLRVTAELVNVADGYQVWSERYDREMADVFDIQDDIASSIATTIQPALVGSENAAATARRHGGNVAAFELYLKGRHLWHQRTPQSLSAARAYFEQAVALDPEYALAHAGVADSFGVPAFYGYAPPAEIRQRAETSARRAMTLDPGLAESHFAMGICALWLVQWPDARRHFLQALEIDPTSALAAGYAALCLALEGQHDAAQREARNAIALDALAPFPYAAAASTFHVGGRYEDAIRFSARALELYPDFALGLWAMTLSCSQSARFAEAIAAAERLVALTDRAPVFVGLLGHACAAAGRRNEALKIGDELAARRAAAEYVTPTAEVLVWAALDDRDQCYRALLRVVEEGVTGAIIVTWIPPYLSALNEESRFARLFDRLQITIEPTTSQTARR